MLKWVFHIVFISFVAFGLYCQPRFGEFASAVLIRNCGSNVFYNTTGDGVNCINTDCSITFQGRNYGTFNQNSNGLIFLGGEIKTWKNNDGNSCGGFINYTVYPTGSRPSSPIFTQLALNFFSNCCGATFCVGGGPCGGNDQKWQSSNHNFDLTARAIGNYTIELYYDYSGNDGGTVGCPNTNYINNGDNPTNYTATFSVVTPGSGACTILPIELLSFKASCDENTLGVYWQTVSERDNAFFVVEACGDDLNWEQIKTIEGQGNSTEVVHYDQTVERDLDWKYLRLKQVDYNGNYHYFEPIVLACEEDFPSVFVYESYGKTILIPKKSTGQIEVFDAKGALVKSFTVKQEHINEKFELELAAGFYGVVFKSSMGKIDILKHIKW